MNDYDDEEPFETKVDLVISGFEPLAESMSVRACVSVYNGLGGQAIGVELTDFFANTPGNGCGTKVMNELVRRADKEGVSLYVWPSSNRNREFYSRFGFGSRKGSSGMAHYPPLPEWFIQEQQASASQLN